MSKEKEAKLKNDLESYEQKLQAKRQKIDDKSDENTKTEKQTETTQSCIIMDSDIQNKIGTILLVNNTTVIIITIYISNTSFLQCA